MRVSVLEPWGAVYEGNMEQVILPGEDGDLCVLDFHHPFLHRLRKGVIEMTRQGGLAPTRGRTAVGAAAGRPLRIAILEGVARMSSNELVIMVETERSKQKAVGR